MSSPSRFDSTGHRVAPRRIEARRENPFPEIIEREYRERREANGRE